MTLEVVDCKHHALVMAMWALKFSTTVWAAGGVIRIGPCQTMYSSCVFCMERLAMVGE